MGTWVKRLGAAALVVASVLGCGELAGCRPSAPAPVPVAATPARPPGQTAAGIVGTWRMTVNGEHDSPLVATFDPAGQVATTDPGMGIWRPRTAGPGDVEGVWDIPLAGLRVTFVLAVDGDRFVGTGLAAETATPGRLHPVTMTGVRVTVDAAVVAQIPPPPGRT